MTGILAALLLLHAGGAGDADWAMVIAAAICMAMLGFVDDLRGLPVRLRLLSQCAVAAALVVVTVGSAVGWVAGLALTLLVVWLVNLFNFMDGIDGLAGGHAVFMLLATALLLWRDGGDEGSAVLALAAAVAVAAFLCWNWPPAKLFMGDTGSLGLGMLLAGMMLLTVVRGQLPAAVWLILWSPLVCDATLTLLHRAWRREALHRAHRDHAYQRLARRWDSHHRVTRALLLVDGLWLLPLALLAHSSARWAAGIALFALVPLALIVVAVLRADSAQDAA
jgi:Fuc2NAc and GlcNAc transferase